MTNRSNINLVGNTVTGQNLGTGAEVFKCKSGGSNLQFKTISTTGTSLSIINCDNQIYISGATGGGSGIQTAGNGLTRVGTNVVLGGALTEDTCITIPDATGLYVTGGTVWNNWGLQVTNSSVVIGDTCSDLGTDSFIGIGGGLNIGVKGSDNNINICNFGINGNVCVRASDGFVGIEGGDGIRLCNLSSKTSETCAVYIDSSGKLSYGTISGGGGGISWNGNTVGGLGTYVDSSTICSQPKLKFDTTGLHVTGRTYISGLTTGNTSNIIHYDTITHELYTDKLTAGTDGALQFNDNGVLGGTNLIWNSSVSGFTWGTGYTPTESNVFTIIKKCDYKDGTPTGFISMGIDSEYGQDMFNLCYVSNYPSDVSCSVISSRIPLHITSGDGGYCSFMNLDSSSYLLCVPLGYATIRTNTGIFMCTNSTSVVINGTSFGNTGIYSDKDYTDFYQSSACNFNQITSQKYHNEKFILINNTTGTTAVLLGHGAAHNQYICLKKYDSIINPVIHHTAMSFDACVTGVEAVTGDMVSFFFEGAIKRVSGGTVSFVGTPTKVSYKDSGLSTADANVYANNTDKRLDICVCGLSSKNIMWSSVVNTAEIVAVK